MYFYLILIFLLGYVRSQQPNRNVGLNTLVQPKAKPPRPYDGSPVIVSVGLHIESLGNFDTTKMSFEANFYLYLSWKDGRFGHGDSEPEVIQNYQELNNRWIPDVHFPNAIRDHFHNTPIPNFYLSTESDGTTIYSIRPVVFRFFHCNDGQTEDKVQLEWLENDPITWNENIKLSQFTIQQNITTHSCNITTRKLTKGNFGCLFGKITLHRPLIHHLIHSYIPTGFIVIISWISFCLDRHAIMARITHGFICLLCLCTLLVGIRLSTPVTSYGKAIDYWLIACFFFLIGVLIEFVWINAIIKRAEKCQKNVKKIGAHFQQRLKSSENNTLSLTGKRVGLNAVVDSGCTMAVLDEEANFMNRKARRIDSVCKILFPLLFLIFNLIYWLFYLQLIPLSKWIAD